MLTQEQNETLCRVGPGTPMGDLMRRYWVPAALSWEVPEPDSPPITIKLLGEELVAFRQTDGRVGVVGARCAHRRAHLFWGRNEENGIRCVYHGWKFDCEGACVDMPSEPEESNFKDKVHIPAYPTVEAGGVIWAYMGPPEKKPAPPLFEWTQVPATHRGISKVWQQCNWLQALEGGIDSSHINYLHGGKPPGQRYDDNTVAGRARNLSGAPVIEVVPTDYGYTYAGIRTLGDEGNYVRGYHWIMPWYQLRPGIPSDSGASGHMWVPMDDENTIVYNMHYTFPEKAAHDHLMDPSEASTPVWFRDAREPVGAGNAFGDDVDPSDNFRATRNMDNKYKIDRELQKTTTFTGITGTNVQDRAVQESMGAIADRTLERLGTTDRAIINARRTLLKAVKTVQDGGEPPGVAPTYYKLRSRETVLPANVQWFEAMKPILFQIDGPKAPATA
ncbi:MAG: Rieske 2Fe-2S domain-containing protein [Dehalococcoidia bacterium]|nr:Rieske 2Fe-2S domain-containing protein [Dehalococcoidia bacterium]